MSNIYGTSADDYLFGTDTNDTIIAYAGNDTVYGWSGKDNLYGNEGNDWLDGGYGNDRLSGGTGDDSLVGGYGQDTYVFAKGFGNDTIYNGEDYSNYSNGDKVQFNASIKTSDVTLVRQWEDLLVQVNDSEDSLRISGYFSNDAQSGNTVETLTFADGTVWDIDFIKEQVLTATAQDDQLFGYATNDTIDGLEGNDSIYGNGGNDKLNGGKGADYLSGGLGNDTLKGDAGNDGLSGDEGNDKLYGGLGGDWLNGGSGQDTLDGGTGADYLSGDSGDDTYVFNAGSGQDTIYNYDYSNNTAVNGDVIQFGSGISSEDVVLTREYQDLVIQVNDSEDSLRVSGYFINDATESYAVSSLNFADETSWDIDTIKKMVQQSTDQNDNLYGYSGNDVLNGGNGNDSLMGFAGNDTLRGENGSDWLDGAEGNDALNGGSGDDSLNAGLGDDRLYGGKGADWLSGGEGNDFLTGQTGNDTMMGDLGQDIYTFGRGYGQDTIYNNAYEMVFVDNEWGGWWEYTDVGSSNGDTIAMTSSVAVSDVTVTRQYDDLLLALGNGTDSLRVSNYFYNEGQSSYTVENIQFNDGTTWHYSDVVAMVPVIDVPPVEEIPTDPPVESFSSVSLAQQTDALVSTLAALPSTNGAAATTLAANSSSFVMPLIAVQA